MWCRKGCAYVLSEIKNRSVAITTDHPYVHELGGQTFINFIIIDFHGIKTENSNLMLRKFFVSKYMKNRIFIEIEKDISILVNYDIV